jgi:choline dehydrogenase-like flavoprotein
MSTHAERLMNEIWTEAGAQKMWTYQRNAHLIRTCRMRTNADENVVDDNCRLSDVPNLYVCDNSFLLRRCGSFLH